MQCGMAVFKEGERWSVASRDFPANRGRLCRKGWTAAALLDSPDRLTSPLIRDRKGGKLRPTTWDEALDHVVTKFNSIAVRSGANAIGVFGGGGLTNEKAYMLGKFARVALRTANIDTMGASACRQPRLRACGHSVSIAACLSRWRISPRRRQS